MGIQRWSWAALASVGLGGVAVGSAARAAEAETEAAGEGSQQRTTGESAESGRNAPPGILIEKGRTQASPLQGRLERIGVDSIELKSLGGTTYTIKADATTNVLRAGEPMPGLESLGAGENVRVSYTIDDEGVRATVIDVVPNPPWGGSPAPGGGSPSKEGDARGEPQGGGRANE